VRPVYELSNNQYSKGDLKMRKSSVFLWAVIFVLVCATTAFADVEWMDTMTSNGNKYLGFVENGDLNGFGCYRMTTGREYYGLFSNGDFSGFGIYVYKDSEEETAYLTLGYFIENKINRRGIIHYKDGLRYEGPYENGERLSKVGYTLDEYGFVKDILLNGSDSYTGEVSPDTTTPNGFGILIKQDGAIYVGQFASGNREGYGLYVSPEKHFASGTWADDELVDPGAEWK